MMASWVNSLLVIEELYKTTSTKEHTHKVHGQMTDEAFGE